MDIPSVAAFIDAALQYESSWERAEDHELLHGGGLEYYGASVGAIRGTLRNARRRYPDLRHDDVVRLASELWSRPVFERRLTAVVLLQSSAQLLRHTDLTRIEGFLRTAGLPYLEDALALDVVAPLMEQLSGQEAARARVVLERWAGGDSMPLQRAAVRAATGRRSSG
ncbi:DNA alkylation repair protein [Arthrobacter echini]|uniref:DNA alkylation repair protein n=1 Tax=Arthrobacter echini TaxID=1529066 RepID=UPI0021CCDC34|nr:DNA alkylation repair protein [Arthrobacter echini]